MFIFLCELGRCSLAFGYGKAGCIPFIGESLPQWLWRELNVVVFACLGEFLASAPAAKGHALVDTDYGSRNPVIGLVSYSLGVDMSERPFWVLATHSLDWELAVWESV